MKISNTPQHYINQAYNKPKGPAPNSGTKTPEETKPGDSIRLSATTRDLQKISASAAKEQPERAKMVQDLKLKVENNQYTVNAEALAEKMIGSIMDELG